MLTDALPRNKILRTQFKKSDGLRTLKVPKNDRLRQLTAAIEEALASGQTRVVRLACAKFVGAAAEFYKVRCPEIRILGSRPRRVWELGDVTVASTELFGDYRPGTNVIRVWMRTAVRNQTTSFGTFFSTLCHEFCHHLDVQRFNFQGSPHTRGFFGRTAALYHHARGTAYKRLFWIALPGERYRIDWQRTNRSAATRSRSDAAVQIQAIPGGRG